MKSLDNAKLYELAETLAPNAPSLLEEVQLAVDDPADYVRRFRERLALRGISNPDPGITVDRFGRWFGGTELSC